MGRRALEGMEKVHGPEHPHTLANMANLASTYQSQGRWKKAEELQRRELEICSKVLGQEHPDTLTSMFNLATIWKCQECNDKALKLMIECVQLRKKILGVEHPATQSSLNILNKWEKERSFSHHGVFDSDTCG